MEPLNEQDIAQDIWDVISDRKNASDLMVKGYRQAKNIPGMFRQKGCKKFVPRFWRDHEIYTTENAALL